MSRPWSMGGQDGHKGSGATGAQASGLTWRGPKLRVHRFVCAQDRRRLAGLRDGEVEEQGGSLTVAA